MTVTGRPSYVDPSTATSSMRSVTSPSTSITRSDASNVDGSWNATVYTNVCRRVVRPSESTNPPRDDACRVAGVRGLKEKSVAAFGRMLGG